MVEVRLFSRPEVIERVGVTFPTLWTMMHRGEFPRAIIVAGGSLWRADAIDAWIDALPRRRYKSDECLPDGDPARVKAGGASVAPAVRRRAVTARKRRRGRKP